MNQTFSSLLYTEKSAGNFDLYDNRADPSRSNIVFPPTSSDLTINERVSKHLLSLIGILLTSFAREANKQTLTLMSLINVQCTLI